MAGTVDWLLAADEPWTRYRTLVDLLDRPEDDAEVRAARVEMLAHPRVRALIDDVAGWPGYAIKRHNDSGHPLHKLSTLADFGLRSSDPGLAPAVEAVLAHQSPEGAFQTLANIGRSYGGTGEDAWLWMLCDAPVLLHSLLALGLGHDPRGRRAAEHLAGLVDENGYRCVTTAELGGKFRGPGKKTDPCPIANVYAMKALAQVPEVADGPAARVAAEMLLGHWERRGETKHYLFGIGTDFGKLKYPFIWYDILHVADTLSRFPFFWTDPRLQEMVGAITVQADAEGRYTAGSMYRPWKDWSFADKKAPSPWLTLLVKRISRRMSPLPQSAPARG